MMNIHYLVRQALYISQDIVEQIEYVREMAFTTEEADQLEDELFAVKFNTQGQS